MFKQLTRVMLATGIMVSSLGIATVASAQPFLPHYHHHWHHRHWAHHHWRH